MLNSEYRDVLLGFAAYSEFFIPNSAFVFHHLIKLISISVLK